MIAKTGQAIQKQLKQGVSKEKIFKTLHSRSSYAENPKAFLDLCRFLYLSGQHQLLIKVAIHQLKKKELVPWAFLIEILSIHNISLSSQTRQVFLKGIKEQKQIKLTVACNSWDNLEPEFKNLKTKAIEQINKKNNPIFVKLMEDLKFVQAQGILNKAGDILKELKKISPENPYVQELWLKFREQWGRDLIYKKKRALLSKKMPFDEQPPEKEKAQAETIAKEILTLLKKDSSQAYNMALFFSFVGYPRLSLKILKPYLKSHPSLWLYLDLLLQSQLYIECLHFLDTLSVQYKNDPEATFALTYARAKAYSGLNKKDKAYKILTELHSARPHYRLTHYLLKQWEKEKAL